MDQRQREQAAELLAQLADIIAAHEVSVVGQRINVEAGPGHTGKLVGSSISVSHRGGHGSVVGSEISVSSSDLEAAYRARDSLARGVRELSDTARDTGKPSLIRSMLDTMSGEIAKYGGRDLYQQVIALLS